ADALAAQVSRRADAGVHANVDAGMPEQPRHEGGDAHIGRRPGRDGAHVARERKLRDVEFLVAERAEKNFLGIERQIRDGAALDLHPAVADGARAVVISAGNRYRHLDHGASRSACSGVGWAEARNARRRYLLLLWL